ncbi:MAG: acyltransferase [bacterium]|nr:acyltransferase [Mycoplasmatota bacterium]MDD6757273.1 acyltransferase [bacterium]MDY2908584.1 acyltransferase [Candidatus Faecimonas sp.]
MSLDKRIKYCDFLRGLAMILVILIHIYSIYRGIYFNKNKIYYFILSLGDSFTRIAVPTFFMITGIFMLNKSYDESYKDYLLKRMPKLIVTFIIFSGIYYIYEAHRTSNELSILYFCQILTTYGGFKYHLWFMYEIIRIYFLIPFISVLVKNLTREKLKDLIILIFILGNILQFSQWFTYKYEINLFAGISFSSLAICTNYLLLGYYLFKYDISKKSRIKIYIVGIISIFLMPIADIIYLGNVRSGDDVIYTVSSIFPIFPAIGIFVLFKYNYNKFHVPAVIEKVMSKIAKNSLYIYMVHVIILEYLNRFLQNLFNIDSFIQVILLIFILLILTTILSLICSVIINYIYNFVEDKIKKIIRMWKGKIYEKQKNRQN